MALHAAVVFSSEGIQLLTAGRSAEMVMRLVAGYVSGQAEHMLWPEDAGRVRDLLADSRPEDAVHLYFSRVGERWTREFLKIEAIEEDAGAP